MIEKLRSKKHGFTLAEVLITLAIIGIVAALTIPAVVNNYQKTQTLTQLRKAYSQLNQAVSMSETYNSSIENWDFTLSPQEFYEKYLKDYLKTAGYYDNNEFLKLKYKFVGGGSSVAGITTVFSNPATIKMFLRDGTMLAIGDETSTPKTIYVDVNGTKKPNTWGEDLFVFKFSKTKKILPFCTTFYATGAYSCTKDNSGFCCSAKIMNEGWQIKDDYPW